VQLIRGVYHLGVSSEVGSRWSGPNSVFWSLFSFYQQCWRTRWLWSGVFIVKVEGLGEEGSGDTMTVNVEILLQAFLNNLWTWVYFPQLLKYQDFLSIRISSWI